MVSKKHSKFQTDPFSMESLDADISHYVEAI